MGSISYMWKYEIDDFEEVLNSWLFFNQKVESIWYDSALLHQTPKLDKRSRLKLNFINSKYNEESMLKVNSTIFKDNKKLINSKTHIWALNEITIDSGQFNKILKLEMYINDIFLTVFEGYGLILSTPTGSTAYNMSSGGSVVCTTIDTMTVTPMNSRSMTMRTLVLPPDWCLRLVPMSPVCRVTVDGDFMIKWPAGMSVQVTGSNSPVKFISNPNENPIKEWIDNLISLNINVNHKL